MEEVLTVKEAAAFLKIHRSELTRMIHMGLFPGAYRSGTGGKTSPIHIPRSAITYYQESRPKVAG